MSSLQRFVETRAQEWDCRPLRRKSDVKPIITISREPGCDTKTVLEKLAQEFGMALYGDGIVDRIARDARVSARVVATLDERVSSQFEAWLTASFLGDRCLSSHAYLSALTKVVFAIASHGYAIILGRGAHFLLPPNKRLALRLVAPMSVRLKNIMEKRNLSKKQAEKHIAEKEMERQEFVTKHFHRNIMDPSNYDLTINTASIKPDAIVNIVKVFVPSMFRESEEGSFEPERRHHKQLMDE
jgi:cytidylate kinase